MSQSPTDEQAESTSKWLEARNDLAEMIKRGRSFSGHERNCCFLNTGDGQFATVSAVSGLDFADDARAVAVVDWDQDGDLDAWISNRNAPRVRLMRNDATNIHRSIQLRLVGNGGTTNRDAIGARVEVVLDAAGPRRLVQTLRAGEGFLGQSSKWLHFGLGDATGIDRVVVAWPGGPIEKFTNLRADRRYVLEQERGEAVEVPPRDANLALAASQPAAIPRSGTTRVPLVKRLPMPSLTFQTGPRSPRQIPFGSGKPVLLHLWASWCPPCIQELKEFTLRASELRAAGLEVIAVSVDGLGDDDSSPTQAAAAIERIGFPFPAGGGTAELIDTLQAMHNELVVLWEPLPVPTSFLVDGNGNLNTIYKGPISVDQVLEDAATPEGGYVARWGRAACVPGRVLDHARMAATAAEGESSTRYRIAALHEAAGRLDDAIAGFVALAEQNPESPSPWSRLGAIYLGQGRLDLAAEACTNALKIDPSYALAHNSLGLVRVQQRQFAAAERHYRQAIAVEPEMAMAHNNLGSLLASQGNLPEARQHFRRAVEADSDFAEAHTNLGSVYAAENNLRSAADHYRLAIRSDPTYAEAHNNLGSIYARSGDLPRAIACYRRAVEINPNYQEAIRNLQRAQSLLEQRAN